MPPAPENFSYFLLEIPYFDTYWHVNFLNHTPVGGVLTPSSVRHCVDHKRLGSIRAGLTSISTVRTCAYGPGLERVPERHAAKILSIRPFLCYFCVQKIPKSLSSDALFEHTFHQIPFSARWGSLRRSPDPVVGWGTPLPPHSVSRSRRPSHLSSGALGSIRRFDAWSYCYCVVRRAGQLVEIWKSVGEGETGVRYPGQLLRTRWASRYWSALGRHAGSRALLSYMLVLLLPPPKEVMLSLRSVCLSTLLYGRNSRSILMKLGTVVWNPKGKIDFVGSQNPTTPFPSFPQPNFSPYYCPRITEKVVNKFWRNFLEM